MFTLSTLASLHIEPTTRCNASCPVCVRNIAGGPLAPGITLTELTAADLQAFLPDAAFERLSDILFCGNAGDPAACTELVEMIDWLRSKRKLYIAVATNGGLRPPAWWADLARVMSGRVTFSLDGLTDTNHLYRRNVRFDVALANAQAFIAAGGRAIWSFLVFGHNEHQIEEARDLAKKLGFERFEARKALGFSGGNQMPVFKRDGTFDYFLSPPSPAWRLDGSTDPVVPRTDTPLLSDLDTPMAVPMPSGRPIACKSQIQGEMFITAEGLLLPCCWMGAQARHRMPDAATEEIASILRDHRDVLDLRQRPITDILNDPEYNRLLEPTLHSFDVCDRTCSVRSVIDKIRSV